MVVVVTVPEMASSEIETNVRGIARPGIEVRPGIVSRVIPSPIIIDPEIGTGVSVTRIVIAGIVAGGRPVALALGIARIPTAPVLRIDLGALGVFLIRVGGVALGGVAAVASVAITDPILDRLVVPDHGVDLAERSGQVGAGPVIVRIIGTAREKKRDGQKHPSREPPALCSPGSGRLFYINLPGRITSETGHNEASILKRGTFSTLPRLLVTPPKGPMGLRIPPLANPHHHQFRTF